MVAVEPLLILALALAPGVFWAWYFYRRDRFEPEPAAMVVKIFILGLLVTFPVAFTEGFIGLFIVSPILMGAVVAPMVEEYGKFAVVRRFACQNTEFDEPMDGIVYAAAAALGLATLENVLYVFSAYLTSPSLAFSTVIVRAIFSVPGHALFAGAGATLSVRPGSRPPRSDPPSSVGGSFWGWRCTAYSISCSSPQKSSLMPWPRSSWS